MRRLVSVDGRDKPGHDIQSVEGGRISISNTISDGSCEGAAVCVHLRSSVASSCSPATLPYLARVSDDLDIRRRQLRYRSWHRGTRELDLVLGPFADSALGELSAEQLDRYAALLENSDPDIFGWVSGRDPAPPAHADMIRLLHRHKRS